METYEASQQFQYSSYQHVDRVEENKWTHESNEENMHILKELLKEIDHKGYKMCKKLVHKVEKDVRIGGVVRKRVHDLCGKSGSDMLEKIIRKLNEDEEESDVISRERGGDGEFLQEIKLDRFKVKTMNTIGVGVDRVVKEEAR